MPVRASRAPTARLMSVFAAYAKGVVGGVSCGAVAQRYFPIFRGEGIGINVSSEQTHRAEEFDLGQEADGMLPF